MGKSFRESALKEGHLKPKSKKDKEIIKKDRKKKT